MMPYKYRKQEILLTTCLVVVVVGMNVGYWSQYFYGPEPKPQGCAYPIWAMEAKSSVKPVKASHLHNVFWLSNNLYSGSGPESEEAFRELQKEWNITTIISVDGATPDVALAEKYGMRYIHIPIGYDGIPNETAYRLARAYQTAPGMVYIHCHHGMHRGPAAAAAIQLCTDQYFSTENAVVWLKMAGTDPKYRGLYNLPQTLKRPSPDELAKIPADFPTVAKVPDLTRHMVVIDQHWDHLKLVKAAGWKTPPDHPDVDPAHEALQLLEAYRETARLEESRRKGSGFMTSLIEAESGAVELEKALQAKPFSPDAAAKAFGRVQASCASCHKHFRD